MSAVEICSRTNKALKSRDAHMRDQIYSWKSQFDDITNWKVKSQNAKLDDFIISRYYIAAAIGVVALLGQDNPNKETPGRTTCSVSLPLHSLITGYEIIIFQLNDAHPSCDHTG